MTGLVTSPNLADPDGVYDWLIRLHEGLSEEESRAVNARLILILMNQIGDRDILRAAMTAARPGVEFD